MTDLCVIGLGYVGLPLAQAALRKGLAVAGLDVNPLTVANLASGRSHVDDLTDEDVVELLRRGFQVTSDPGILNEADAVLICVPTPLGAGGGPDLTAVLSAAKSVAEHMRPGMLVVLESTTYPGTTEEVLRPVLEMSGLAAGRDFHLAFSPERVDPGNVAFTVANTPKVVGGLTPACTDRAVSVYERFVPEVVRARGLKEAELAKLLENTYRHVNIALVNEMARFCHELDIDLWDVIRCASTKPFGFSPFYPGPGVGGHCIPIDPNYLSFQVRAKLGYPFRFVELAQEINASMPSYVARRSMELLNERGMAVREARVLLLGVTYKPDIADERESPSRAVATALKGFGAIVNYHDPFVPIWRFNGVELISVDSYLEAAADADLTILLQDHSCYDLQALAAKSTLLFDTRGQAPREAAHLL